jgi:DNA-binding response OmpR family regulator
MKKILIIDESSEILNTMKMYLEETSKCQVEIARSFEQASEIVPVFKPNVIILDYFWNREVVTFLNGLGRLYTPPPRIIIMSTMPNIREHLSDINAEFIVKPFSIDEFDILLRCHDNT